MKKEYPPGFFKAVRHRIADLLANEKSYRLPAVCRRYGLADGLDAEAHSGKYNYVARRLDDLGGDQLIDVATKVAQEEDDQELQRLLSTISSDPDETVSSTSMPKAHRTYYSVRTGKHPTGGRLTLEALKGLYRSEAQRLTEAGYLHEHFGYWCIDAGEIEGSLGRDVSARVLYYLGKDNLWPILEHISDYSEDDLFDVIEFMYDHVSKPLSGFFHSYGGCGHHWDTFDAAEGRAEYRSTINHVLSRYGEGYELSERGEILELGPKGTGSLLDTSLPSNDANVAERVESAILKFRRYKSTQSERRDAVRDLADVLEYLRADAKEVIAKADEGDLFNIANNFGIRHHRPGQKTDYDQSIWLSWMFYFYLATIHACVRLIEKKKSAP